jgi:hypothetical protein
MTTLLLVMVSRPVTPASTPPTKTSSTSTSPRSLPEVGSIARRSFCSHAQAVS